MEKLDEVLAMFGEPGGVVTHYAGGAVARVDCEYPTLVVEVGADTKYRRLDIGRFQRSRELDLEKLPESLEGLRVPPKIDIPAGGGKGA